MKLAAVVAVASLALAVAGSALAQPAPDFVDRFVVSQSQQPPDFVDRFIVGQADRVPDLVDRRVAAQPAPDFVDRFIVGHARALDSADRYAAGRVVAMPDFVDRFVVGHGRPPLDSADRYAAGRPVYVPDFVDRFVARTTSAPTPTVVGGSTDDGSSVPVPAALGTAALLLLALGAALHVRSRRRVLQPL